jgi:hypothetical protein
MTLPPAPLLEQPTVVHYLVGLICSYSQVGDQARWTQGFSSDSGCRSVKPYVHWCCILVCLYELAGGLFKLIFF